MKNIINVGVQCGISALMLLTFLSTGHSFVYAQDATEDQITEILSDIEDERTKDLENQLALNLPIETDNPNFVMTFTDPSGKGVYIQVDGKDYIKIDSPYTFQTLGIGQHTILLKFNDNQQTQQILEKKLVIIPRVPQIKAPEISNGVLTVNGTGIALGTAEIVLTNGIENFAATTEIDLKGYWTYKFENITTDGKYTLFASIRKNGYASKLSEAMSFELSEDQIGGTNSATTTLVTSAISFKFSDFKPEDIQSIVAKNPDLIIYTGVQVILGMLLGLFLAKIGKSKDLKKTETLLKNAFISKNQNNTQTPNAQDITNVQSGNFTLVDKLKKAGVNNGNLVEPKKTLDNTIPEINSEAKPSDNSKEQPENKNQNIEEEKSKKLIKDNKTSLLNKLFKKKEKANSENNSLSKEIKPKVESKPTQDIEEDIKENPDEEPSKDNIDEPLKFDATEEQAISKDDFLKKFKEFDPDDEQGREVKPNISSNKKSKKAEKRNIRISLTSEK